MPTTTVQVTNLIGTGNQFNIGVGSTNLFIVGGVIVASTDNIAIFSTATDTSVHLDGTVISGDGAAIRLNGGTSLLSVGETGIVRSSERNYTNTTVYLSAGNNTLTNHGQIYGEYTTGILFEGGDNTGTNFGTIAGTSGVFLGLFGGTNDRFVNAGDIVATDNSGVISTRYNNGIYAEGDNTTIINQATGTITANSIDGAGIAVGHGAYGGNGSQVWNHGTVTSLLYWGVDFSSLDALHSAVLKNFGTISGGAGSFRGNTTGDHVRNGGQMLGDVELGDGADRYDGRGGSVDGLINAGDGDDWVTGGALGDTIEGGAGRDVLGGRDGDDQISGGTEGDTINGGGGDDTLTGDNGADLIRGGAGADDIDGGSKNDTVYGGAGDDTVRGGKNNDQLFGQKGDDELFGETGNDTLNGGAGNDTLTGGDDSDTFVFGRSAGDDVILDFTDGSDVIDLTAYGIQNFNRLNTLGAIRAEDGGVLIDLGALGGSGSIWLDGFDIANLNNADFIF